METTIMYTGIADFCEEQTTVTVTVCDADNEEFTFHVQTCDSEHRSDLGCWVLNEVHADDTDYDDFPTIDFDVVIEAAQNYLSEDQSYVHIGIGDYYAWVVGAEYRLVTHNDSYVNSDTSSYQRKYSDVISTFGSMDELKAFAKNKEVA